MLFFLFLVLVVFMLAGPLLRLALRMFFFRKGFSGQNFSQQERPRKEGEVSIDYMPPRKDLRDNCPGNGSAGDYVDYEEVKD